MLYQKPYIEPVANSTKKLFLVLQQNDLNTTSHHQYILGIEHCVLIVILTSNQKVQKHFLFYLHSNNY